MVKPVSCCALHKKIKDCTFTGMKQFNVPFIYRSSLIAAVKNKRKELDKMKKDFMPALLDFGFCYGVENAIDIALRTIDENHGKRIILLSEMIHNPQVNADLLQRGVQFLQDTNGNQVIPFNTLTKDDIVIIPAFGTTLAIEAALNEMGIVTEKYNTTCPFVEKVWNRSQQIAAKNYSVIVHGKPSHEETRATFSHAAHHSPTVVVNDMQETIELSKYITGQKESSLFYEEFKGRFSRGFNIETDLERIGVVNQTTMLASDTQAIADFLKQVMIDKYGLNEGPVDSHFADTRDTLCYATNDNQSAVVGLLQTAADMAIVVGGYNSSNTAHLVELCEEKLPTYFISSEKAIGAEGDILHFNFHTKQSLTTHNFLKDKEPVKILLTSGASCPDAMVEAVIARLISFYPAAKSIQNVMAQFE